MGSIGIAHPFHKKIMQRNMLLFENSTKSSTTRKTYLYHLGKFMSFCEVKDYDELAALPQKKLQIVMEDYVKHLKKTISTNMINLPISAVKSSLIAMMSN
jgi:hypothetical protein